MDWTIVTSVLVALLLVPVAIALVGALMFLTSAVALRGRLRGLMGRAFAHCQRMCNPEELITRAVTCASPESFHGAKHSAARGRHSARSAEGELTPLPDHT